MMKKRIRQRWKDRHLISITPIPKVRLKVFYRPDGSWHYSWGHISYEYLVSKGLYYDKDGKYICTEKHAGMSGQDYTISDLWRHIQKEAYYGNIHPLDIISSPPLNKM